MGETAGRANNTRGRVGKRLRWMGGTRKWSRMKGRRARMSDVQLKLGSLVGQPIRKNDRVNLRRVYWGTAGAALPGLATRLAPPVK